MRIENIARYLFLVRTFRNGVDLARRYRAGLPAAEAVTWGGTRLVHPASRGGLAGTILEVWHEGCYTRGFYRPAPGDVVVDAGAHVGMFSILVARACPGCRVVALEPFAENHACLVRNLASAGASNVTPHRIALGGAAGQGVMEAVGDRSIDHLLRPGASGGDAVPIVTVDGLFDLAGCERLAMFKSDVEGAEHDAFAAASDGALARIDRIALEYHDNLRPGTLAVLKRRLAPTHDVAVRPTEDRGYGILYATLRGRAP
jgi:FkbM family methyltransferase